MHRPAYSWTFDGTHYEIYGDRRLRVWRIRKLRSDFTRRKTGRTGCDSGTPSEPGSQ
jgi:hypothetical protein